MFFLQIKPIRNYTRKTFGKCHLTEFNFSQQIHPGRRNVGNAADNVCGSQRKLLQLFRRRMCFFGPNVFYLLCYYILFWTFKVLRIFDVRRVFQFYQKVFFKNWNEKENEQKNKQHICDLF